MDLPVLTRQDQGRITECTGDPNGQRDAAPGTLCIRRDGSHGSTTLLYIKTSALGTLTGWAGIA